MTPGRSHASSPSAPLPAPPGVGGERQATPSAEELFAQVYDSLKALAHQVRAGRAGDTLGTTALVHEAYLKLAGKTPAIWKDESHFFALASRAMRQVLVDAARRDLALKRGGPERQVVPYEDEVYGPSARPDEMVALDAALRRLETLDPRRARVVELRVFTGLSVAETARLLDLSTATVERDWRAARAWLATELDGARAEGRP